MIPPDTANTPAPLENQHYGGVRYRPAYSPPSYARPNPYMPFPQWTISPVTNQPRRHHRTQNSSSTASAVQGQQQATSVGHTARRRTRPAGETNPQLPRRLSTSQVPRVPAVATATSSSPGMAIGAPHYLTYLTPEDHVRIQRLAELQAYTSSMRTGSVVHGSHRQHSLDDDGIGDRGSSTPKGLDDTTDGRPEPKEDKDLTVNLECKICMSQLVDTVTIPCGHAILCPGALSSTYRPVNSIKLGSRGDPFALCVVESSNPRYGLGFGEGIALTLLLSRCESTCPDTPRDSNMPGLTSYLRLRPAAALAILRSLYSAVSENIKVHSPEKPRIRIAEQKRR